MISAPSSSANSNPTWVLPAAVAPVKNQHAAVGGGSGTASGENIDIIAMLNKLQFRAFVEGSEVGNTRSKPTVWTQKDKFADEVTKNQEAVAKLVAAGKTGNLDQIKAAVGPVGQSCKSCHDEFRKD